VLVIPPVDHVIGKLDVTLIPTYQESIARVMLQIQPAQIQPDAVGAIALQKIVTIILLTHHVTMQLILGLEITVLTLKAQALAKKIIVGVLPYILTKLFVTVQAIVNGQEAQLPDFVKP